MSRALPIALATAVLALAAGCGDDVDAEAQVAPVDELAGQIVGATPEEVCDLLTPEYSEALADSGGCPGEDDIDAFAAITDTLYDGQVELGERSAIEDHSLSFDGGTGRLVLCPGGPACISDRGAYVLTLVDVDGEWRIDAIEYRVESF